jgi:hypothetical protein
LEKLENSRNFANTGAVVQCCSRARCGIEPARYLAKQSRCGSTSTRRERESRDVEINVCGSSWLRIRTMSKDVVKVDEFEALAKKKMPKMAFDYYASGAEDEHTLQQNRDAFSRIR